MLDSGDYATAVDAAVRDGGLGELEAKREAARAEGRLYGIGHAAVIEPSISNMSYITTLLTPEERQKAGPKDGALAVATVAVDPSGAVTVSTASVPQGQGHQTVLAQVVAEALGLTPEAIRVAVEHDTGRDPWSIASGNYASRFAGAVAGAAHIAANRIRDKLARAASQQLNVAVEALAFGDGRIFARDNPENVLLFRRVAGLFHWSPGSLPEDLGFGLNETAQWNLAELTPPDANDRINSSGAYGFIFDFCGVEIDRETGRVQIDRYVTMHDAGRLLNPAIVEGQVLGGFAHGLGATLYEAFAYGADGSFLSGSFADYLVPTATEVPRPVVLHMASPSPFTPLGAKGVGEGNPMSTPVCIANAVADALDIDEVSLPLTPARVAQLIHGDEPPAPGPAELAIEGPTGGRALSGAGIVTMALAAEEIWNLILDPVALPALIPGCRRLEAVDAHHFHRTAVLGVGPVKGVFEAEIAFSNLTPFSALSVTGSASGPLGASGGTAEIELVAVDGGAEVRYRYRVTVSGKVAAVGGRMLEGAARALIGQFFRRLAAQAAGEPAAVSWWHRLLARLGLGA